MKRNDNQKAVIGVVECAAGCDKEPRQIYKGNSFSSNQAPFDRTNQSKIMMESNC